ncbi:MAG: site-2 protease family protein [Zoogloeaceae bacterium]|jgi:Zn-dependent protease|nr:site-2 protease family protein [Zoogloeaceae bacterium]
MDNLSAKIAFLAIATVPLLLGITLHEAAHAYAARHFGDRTAEKMGRISLNPLRHIDPFGTVILPLLLFFTSGFWFGYARPVPVDFARLKRPKENMLWVALAGPAANFGMAIGWALVGALAHVLPLLDYNNALLVMCNAGVFINLMLMFLNLIPLPPLDGGRIATSLLPLSLARPYARLEPFGIVIILLLAVSGLLGAFLMPLVGGTAFWLNSLFSLS